MYGAYLDESFDDGKSGVYAVAAVFGDGWNVIRAEELWKDLLIKHNLKVFKSRKFRKRPKVLAEFAEAICDSGLLACGVIANPFEVFHALSGSALHKQYKSEPYMLLYQQLFVNIAMDVRRAGAKDYVSFVCDEHARYQEIMMRAFEDLRNINPQSAPYMGSCTMEADDSCIPLQMADLIAGELRLQSPKWLQGNPSLTPISEMLIERDVLWSVKHMNDRSLKFVRELVDNRV